MGIKTFQSLKMAYEEDNNLQKRQNLNQGLERHQRRQIKWKSDEFFAFERSRIDNKTTVRTNGDINWFCDPIQTDNLGISRLHHDNLFSSLWP